ncbi:PQQ-binding-like beta-propeller repeat protein [Streptomyces naphthomycinicus]|uniref:outer membrane protein assembly factor BamB family protein n=1 Tax=Streptomyces naphthomycinicus TaxID=2872625 RepID=UPI001CECD3A6|nr:PQQ-binding-like beta-propeller repeat protein [Streptomyces sp. TML10]
MFIALALLVTGGLVDWYESRDVVTGAHGPFPAAFAAEAPVAPEHVVRRAGGEQALVHGLSLRWTDSGMAAMNLRTGKEYWRYERRDSNDSAVWSFGMSERTVVARFTDGKLVALDLRTGKPLWHAEIRAGDRHRSVELVGGRAVTEDPGAVRAFDERSGRSLWTVNTPESCPEVFLHSVHTPPNHLSAVHVMCNASGRYDRDEYGLLLGVDNRTGETLWQQRTADPELTAWSDGHTLVAPDPDHPRTVQLLGMDRQRISVRATLPPDEWDVVAAGGGTVLSGTHPKNGSEDHDTLLRAYDTRDEHPSWQMRPPTGQEYGRPRTADGRVYVVRQPFLTAADAGRRIHADLLVLDAGTGHLLHSLRLPAMTVPDDSDDFEKLNVLDTADGAVGIGWRDGSGDMLIATGGPPPPAPRPLRLQMGVPGTHAVGVAASAGTRFGASDQGAVSRRRVAYTRRNG